ncbi:taste receptor type 1 member 1-like [Hypanus sabinus]|uniref:taste receptor type 1 member 1-like n=1 Tax=Hypanus sabinus TaxID=79690 RepID=UPI0028C494E8|nr:taste receptor type 1 member 1-like [Hypanus sabinus]
MTQRFFSSQDTKLVAYGHFIQCYKSKEEEEAPREQRKEQNKSYFSLLGCNAEKCRMQLNLPGDYFIGGLFHVHDELYHGRSELEITKCKRFSDSGYLRFQTLRFAVEEINNSSSLLPNVTLGYLIFDDCEFGIDIQGALAFVSRHHENITEESLQKSRYQPTVTAVIGPLKSDAAIITNKILGLFDVPQISFGASSDELSDRTQHPTFMRTIPSDANQIEAIVLLIQKFRWNWIAVAASDSDYGESGKHHVISTATAAGICIASHHTIPTHGSGSTPAIIDIFGNITESRANVIVVFAHSEDAERFFQVAVTLNITGKVWILSEAMSVLRKLSEISNIRNIGTILGISLKQGRMAGYEEFVLRDITACSTDNYKPLRCLNLEGERLSSMDDDCRAVCDECVLCTSDGVKSLLRHSEWRIEFNVYSATYAVAYGLHQLLQCDSGECEKKEVYPWQLLKALKKVNFSLDDMQIYFDECGNPPIGYDIIHWVWTNEAVSFKAIGSYTPNPVHLQLDGSLIKWNSQNGQIPTSNCSSECEPGQIKTTIGFQPCCFICEDCAEGTFQNESECLPCSPDQWSPAKSTVCESRTEVYMRWDEGVSIALAILSGTGLLLKASIALVFALYFDTPVIKAAGGKLCFVLLLALAISCGSVYLFIGKPSTEICVARKVVFAVSYETCLACVLVRSFQLVVIFKMATRLPKTYSYWVKYNGQYIFLLISTVIEFFSASIFWTYFRSSVFEKNYDVSKTEIILMCSSGNLFISIIPIAGLILFSLLCFVFAYLGKDLPKNYNEAKCITFSMALVLISWIFLILVLLSGSTSYTSAIEASVILLSSYSITVGYFFPKCYIILFKPQYNTTAFFQTCIQEYTRNRDVQEP